MTNPPLISGQVPSIAATNSGKVTGLPVVTPPETPQGSSGGAGSTSLKRESSDSREANSAENGQQPNKKRRIAPTLISGGATSTGNGSSGSDAPKA